MINGGIISDRAESAMAGCGVRKHGCFRDIIRDGESRLTYGSGIAILTIACQTSAACGSSDGTIPVGQPTADTLPAFWADFPPVIFVSILGVDHYAGRRRSSA